MTTKSQEREIIRPEVNEDERVSHSTPWNSFLIYVLLATNIHRQYRGFIHVEAPKDDISKGER